jgi:hypothetical protein
MPRIRRLRHLLAAALAAAALAAPAPAADTCSCVDQAGNASSISQSGPALCSTARVSSRCAAVALGAPVAAPAAPGGAVAADLDALARQLAAAGVAADPRAALRRARETPPEAWTAREFETVMSVLFALSQRVVAPAELAAVTRFLGDHAAELRARFVDPELRRRAEILELPDFTATVSYGCLELTRSDVLLRAKLPSALALERCTNFR